MSALVEVLVDGERLPLLAMSPGLGVIGAPPLRARGYRYGDLIQTNYVDGMLTASRVVRAGKARTWRFAHALERTRLITLIEACQWLGAAIRATAREIVIAVPEAFSAIPILRECQSAGVSVGSAIAELECVELVNGGVVA